MALVTPRITPSEKAFYCPPQLLGHKVDLEVKYERK